MGKTDRLSKKERECSNQAKFCLELAKRLQESVQTWCDCGCPDWWCINGIDRSTGATKCQIKDEIVKLRRELSTLSKKVG